MLNDEKLDRLQNYGFTSQNAAIVDAVWFTVSGRLEQIGIVLICNPAKVWKAYIGLGLGSLSEKEAAIQVAATGCKVPYEIASAAFPNRFEANEYDQA